jgi:hypothetical protein
MGSLPDSACRRRNRFSFCRSTGLVAARQASKAHRHPRPTASFRVSRTTQYRPIHLSLEFCQVAKPARARSSSQNETTSNWLSGSHHDGPRILPFLTIQVVGFQVNWNWLARQTRFTTERNVEKTQQLLRK